MTARRKLRGQRLPDQDIDVVFNELCWLEQTIKNSSKDYQIQYIIIRLVTILEQFFRNIVQIQLKIYPDYSHQEITLSMPILDDIIRTASAKKRPITKELIISASYSFQNTQAIKDTMQFYRIKDVFLNSKIQEFNKLFTIRNEFVHTLYRPPHDLNPEQFYELTEELMACVLNKIDKNYLDFYLLKGKALLKMGKNEEALVCFNKLIELKPVNPVTHIWKGTALFHLNQFDKVLESVENGIKLERSMPMAYFLKGSALNMLGRLEEALMSIEQAIQLKPNDAVAYSVKGAVLLGLGRLDDALESVESSIMLNPSVPKSHFGKALVLHRLGRQNEALDSIERAIQLNPSDDQSNRIKAAILLQLGRRDEALDSINKSNSY